MAGGAHDKSRFTWRVDQDSWRKTSSVASMGKLWFGVLETLGCEDEQCLYSNDVYFVAVRSNHPGETSWIEREVARQRCLSAISVLRSNTRVGRKRPTGCIAEIVVKGSVCGIETAGKLPRCGSRHQL